MPDAQSRNERQARIKRTIEQTENNLRDAQDALSDQALSKRARENTQARNERREEAIDDLRERLDDLRT
ncbi:MAG: hypothetical protein OWT27_08080 [Firmicutes bacterium]|nr:hypothetical protein [Bacillota bacterium]